MSDTVFVLDANVFIQASRHYYAFDLAPKFWDSLIFHAKNGRIESIDRIKEELERGKDDLAIWANGHLHSAFTSTDEEDIIESYRGIMEWVNSQRQYNNEAIADFASVADGWLIAYAKARGRTIVTHEIPDPNIRRKVPIPNVCIEFHVPFINTFEMLRVLGVQFS